MNFFLPFSGPVVCCVCPARSCQDIAQSIMYGCWVQLTMLSDTYVRDLTLYWHVVLLLSMSYNILSISAFLVQPVSWPLVTPLTISAVPPLLMYMYVSLFTLTYIRHSTLNNINLSTLTYVRLFTLTFPSLSTPPLTLVREFTFFFWSLGVALGLSVCHLG